MTVSVRNAVLFMSYLLRIRRCCLPRHGEGKLEAKASSAAAQRKSTRCTPTDAQVHSDVLARVRDLRTLAARPVRHHGGMTLEQSRTQESAYGPGIPCENHAGRPVDRRHRPAAR